MKNIFEHIIEAEEALDALNLIDAAHPEYPKLVTAHMGTLRGLINALKESDVYDKEISHLVMLSGPRGDAWVGSKNMVDEMRLLESIEHIGFKKK